MIVKELLLSCSIQELTLEGLRQEGLPNKELDIAMELCKYVIQQLEGKDPVDTEHILIGVIFSEDGDESLRACLYRKSDFYDWTGEPEALSGISSVTTLPDEKVNVLCRLSVPPDCYAFDFSPWDEVLGYELLEENIADIGAIPLAAAILLEMTFCGCSEAAIAARQQEIDEALNEAEAIRKLPLAEQKKHYCSSDELWRKMGLPRKTPEERERQRKMFCREMLENNLRKYHALQKYTFTKSN